ncbi:MAG: signal transduction histidine kinase [Salinirussus sp.]|jgi:signal transduction histidine kinase
MRLRTKYALLLLVIVVVLGGVVLGSTELAKGQIVAQEQAELQQTATVSAGQVQTELTQRLVRLENLGSDPDVTLRRTQTPLQRFVNTSEFFAAQVVAPNGTVVDFRGQIDRREDVIGRDVSDRAYIEEALDGNAYIAAPERLSGNIYVVTMAVPLHPRVDDGEATQDGAIVAALRVGRGNGTVGAPEAQVLEPLNTLRQGEQAVSVTAPGLESDRAVLAPAETRFEAELTATATIEPAGRGPAWQLTLRRDRAALTAQLRDLQVVQGASLLVVLTSMLGLGVWQYRTNLRQTERLLEGFRALTDGRFNHRLSLSAAEEWDRISDGFNNLAGGLKTREEIIQKRERRLSVLNRVLRHNVQNDLSVVQSHLEMMPEMGQDRQEDMAETGLEMIDKLLAHSKKADRMDRAMESAQDGVVEVDVADIVTSTVEDHRRKFSDATIRATTPSSQPAWAVSTLEYAVATLLENACVHVTEPTVEVSVSRQDEMVAVTVADDGPGIPESEQEVIGTDQETALDHGSGVGLWLAHLIAEESGGSLVFGDQTDGGRVTLELAAAAVDRGQVAPVNTPTV